MHFKISSCKGLHYLLYYERAWFLFFKKYIDKKYGQHVVVTLAQPNRICRGAICFSRPMADCLGNLSENKQFVVASIVQTNANFSYNFYFNAR